MVVDFGEPAMFGAGVRAMSVDPAVAPTDVAWESAVSDALAARDDVADQTFHAAAFAVESFGDEPKLIAGGDDSESDDGKGIGDFDDIKSQDEEEEEARKDEEPAVLAQSNRRAILDDDDRFWSVARAADAARTELANDPGLADLHGHDDPESDADEELRRDLDQLKQPHVESPAASATALSAHSIFDQMTMATTFDVGTVEVTRTFDALDDELDRAERARNRAAARSAQLPASPPPLAVDETVEDLAWIQAAIANPEAGAKPALSPPTPDPSTEGTNDTAESERSAP